ncbi:MAG: RNA polymerase sigma factor [Verrucomicrobiales bacterium]|nr:RNA polymerase sigma factor [Verrucomicrobiales bacterium]
MPNQELQRCWERWLEAHLDALLLYARSQCSREEDAEDLVQQALAESWRHGEPSLPLVFTIIRRRGIDLVRRTSSRQRRESDLCCLNEAWLEPEVESRDCAAHLARELNKLPSAQREVVLLHVWSGLSFREIGQVMGTSLHTAASRYRAALCALRISLVELSPFPLRTDAQP